jgi:hypothetical protein
MSADEEVCFLEKGENSDKHRADKIKGDGVTECDTIT